MCKSKLKGGMGFRNHQAFNLAMLAKQGWRLLSNPHSLVARIYKAKYYPHGDVLNSKSGSNPSYAWRSIFNSLHVIRRGTRWRVGNGRQIHIWEDKWLPTPSTYKVISPAHPFNDFPMVSALIDIEKRSWKADLVRSMFLPFEANTIINMPLSHNLPEDKIIWVGNRRGDFTVKSAYYIALKVIETNEEGECSRGDARAPLWKGMWNLKIPSKIRIFAWRACMNALPTRINLHRRGINIDVLCPMCEQEAESIAHSLLLCNSARRVWNKLEGCPVNLDDNCIDFSEVAMRILNVGAA